MSTEEAISGVEQVGHSNAMGSEEWRKDAIHRIETGVVTTPTHEQVYVQRPSRRHSGWVGTVVGVGLLGLIVLQIILGGS